MENILDQELITLKEAARLLKNAGRKVHHATCWRWCLKGVRGHRLQSFFVGGQRYTTRRALDAFLSALNGGTVIAASAQRKAAIEAAERELQDEGV